MFSSTAISVIWMAAHMNLGAMTFDLISSSDTPEECLASIEEYEQAHQGQFNPLDTVVCVLLPNSP